MSLSLNRWRCHIYLSHKDMTKIPLLICHLPTSSCEILHVEGACWVEFIAVNSPLCSNIYCISWVIQRGSAGHQMLVSDQITLINTSYNMLTTYRCGVHARQHHAVQADPTAPPACRGPDPRGVLTWTVFASPGAGNMSPLPPPSTTNHYRTDGGVPGGTAERAWTIKLICLLFGILFC